MNFFRKYNGAARLVGAHRGFRGIRPENTCSAFEASLGRCHFIETDIQLSGDGIAVVHHDPQLGRTSNAALVARELRKASLSVHHWSLAELRRLDLGSWFKEDDPFLTIARGQIVAAELEGLPPQRIMTLAELLTWAKRNGLPLNIEIKDQEDRYENSPIVDVLLAEIRAANYADQVLVSSFQHRYLQEIAIKMPELPLGALQEERHPADLISYLRNLGVYAYHPDAEITDEALLTELRQAGFAVNVFTVNDPEQKELLYRQGATSVITDFPFLP